MQQAVFLDRDDTLIANQSVTWDLPSPGDLFDPELVMLLPGVVDGLKALAEAGFVLVVVSNQGGVARGVCSLEQVAATNDRVRELLLAEGGPSFEMMLMCPYHPKGAVAPWNVEHWWRKPGPGMILTAAEVLKVDLKQSWMIGDAGRDIESAVNAGVPIERSILIGEEDVQGVRVRERLFSGAVDRILKEKCSPLRH